MTYRQGEHKKRVVREVDFTALPPVVKERLARCLMGRGAPEPLLANRARALGTVKGWAVSAAAATGLALVTGALGYGDLYDAWALQPPGFAPIYGVAAGLLVLA